MTKRGRYYLRAILTATCALALAIRATATGVPISGFSPFMGLSLTNRFKDENSDSFYLADVETSLVGTQFPTSGTPYYDVALLDTGAAISLITSTADAGFNIQGSGYRGTHSVTIVGAGGNVQATINDPMAMFVTGLANRTGTAPLIFSTSNFAGQSSISLATLPPNSGLPNIAGIPLLSTFATYIRNDQPQMFQLNGKTIRSPQIQLMTRGSGGQGIVRRAQITLDQSDGFSSSAPPFYNWDFSNIFSGQPLTQNPTSPTALEAPGGLFINVDANNVDSNGASHSLGTKQFLLDTGADVTVVSLQNAVSLGIDPFLVQPDFTVSVIAAGGELNAPGYFLDHLTIPAAGGNITADNVPVLVLNLPNPAHSANYVDGIIGTNLLAARNLVIDPSPAAEPGNGPNLYISDPVTISHNWASTAASGSFSTSGSWNAAGTPSILWIANARNVSGSAQEAVASSNSTVWELNVSGSGQATMTVRVSAGVTLSTFSGANIESGGKLRLDGGTLDAQFVDVRGGTLTGAGSVFTGSGPIPGQVENHGGTVAPGNGVGVLSISGRFANAADGTLSFELGGTTPATQYDQLIVDGDVILDGTLNVSLVDLGGGTFSPSVGNSFTLMTATGNLGGAFDHLLVPDGLNWIVNYLANSLQLVVGNPGDFNNDGKVDAQDYVVWRKNSRGPLNFQAWRSHLGVVYSGSGSTSAISAGVPEPCGFILSALSACAFAFRRNRRLTGRFARS
jgi:hypothetical protein